MKNCSKAIFILSGLLAGSAWAATDTFVVSGNWTAPAGVTSATVEAWGGGGGGGRATGNPARGGGGAGGQYASGVVTVVPGNTYAVVVGTGGAGATGGTGDGTAGGDSVFAVNFVVAAGGAGGGVAATNNSAGAAGLGTTVGGTGTVIFAGGNGSSGLATGGAGGGGAGSTGAGGNASGNTAGLGTATGGGDGGAGLTTRGTGNAGTAAGGGGGGGYATNNTNRSGGDGAPGMVTITYNLLPTVTTNAATSVTASGATLNGTVSSNGALTTVTFEYGTTASYGSSATASASPLAAGATNTAVTAIVSGLSCNTLYHYRVNGTNSAGTANGNDVTFTTPACPTAVTLGKTASTSAAAVGSYVTYELTATNSTAAALNNVELTDVIPASMTYVTHAATLGTASLAGQTLTWIIPYLPAGGSSAQLTLVVQPTLKGTFPNTVTSPGATPASADILILPAAITRYSMDEAAGSWTGATGEVIDSGGNGLNGHRRTTATPTTTNAVVPSPTIASQHPSVIGGFCNSGNFDGNAVVESASSTYFQFTNQLSASAWIYPTAYPAGDLYSILSNDVNYEFHLNTTGHLFWWWQASTLTSAATIPLNQWTHIAITLDSTAANRRQRIYINGVQDANTNNWTGTLATNACPFYIGGDIGTGSGCALIPGRNFHGMIDEAKIYNYELSAAEVNADMNLGRFCGTTSFDHIQIEHDGTASTCASKTVTVKACMNAACTSLYPGTVTVHLSPTGWTPSDILTINGGVATATLGNTSIVPPSITLGTTSVSPTPANSTRCFNGATETCIVNIATTACTFDAVEVGANPQTHLYTKLAGTAFNVDVLALSNPTTVNSNYVGAVTVDLVDTSTLACPNGAALNTAQTYTFVTADQGRRTFAMTSANAAPNAQVRIRIGSTSTYACSTDKLAVRPSAVTLTPSNAAAPSPIDANTIRAGAAFNMGATTAPTGYTGILALDTGRLTAQLPSNVSSQLVGGAVGTLTLSPALRANTVQGNNATYNEVGYLYAEPGAFRDSSFTSVDQLGQIAGCAATDTCDCLLSATHFTNGSVPDNLSDVLINGRYGCYVGNKTRFPFGRFIPDHFETAVYAVSGVPMPCPVGLVCPASYNGFVYSGQAFTTQVTARNLAGSSTQNYYSNFAKAVTLSAWDAIGSTTTQNPGPGAVNIPAPLVATDFVGGVGVRKDVLGNPIPYVAYTFTTTPTAPTDIYLRAQDSDNVSSRIAAAPATSIEGGVKVLNGRIRVSNAYGSDLLPLTLTAVAQYYSANGWVNSSTDNVTNTVTTLGLAPTYNVLDALGAVTGTTTPSWVNCTPTATGKFCIRLLAPTGGAGTATVGPTAPGYLPVYPGTATFGSYNNNNNFIYRREN